MAWEWVAPVAAAATGIVGTAFTWWAGHQGRKSTEKVGQQGRQHAEKVARDNATATLNQQREARRAAAYLDVLTTVLDITAGVGTTTSALRFEGQEDPALPVRETQIAASAKVKLYGSPEAQRLYDEWFGAVNKLTANHATLKAMEGRSDPHNRGSKFWLQHPGLIEAMNAATAALSTQMNAELTGDLFESDRPGSEIVAPEPEPGDDNPADGSPVVHM